MACGGSLETVHASAFLTALIARCLTAPQQIYGLPAQPDTYIDVEVDAEYTLHNEMMKTRVGWTPFAGMPVYGRVEQVILRGQLVYQTGEVLAAPGSGRVLFQTRTR